MLSLQQLSFLYKQGVYNSWKSWNLKTLLEISWNLLGLCKVIDRIGFRS